MTTRRVSPVRARAVAVLREVLEKGSRAAPTLTDRSADLSPEDAALLREIVLGVLRWKSALDAELRGASRVALSRLAPNLREILEVALYQMRRLDRVPHYAAVDEAVRHARERGGIRAAKFVNAVLRTLQRAGAPSRATLEALSGHESASELAVRFSHPEFLVERWMERFGQARTAAILAADNGASGLDLMSNPRRTDRESLAAALRSEGIETRLHEASPLALNILVGQPLRSPLFATGHFAIQDTGSQALALLIPAGDTLVDLAAAPGGKSLAAVALGRFRRAIGLDRSMARLRLFEENRRRLGLWEAALVAGDFSAPPLPSRRFDRVLLDAPCSGTGTLRKNPEIRHRVTPQAIDRLALSQREGLLAAASLLVPGGALLYSTCSLEREENEAVVEAALSADAGLELAPIQAPASLAPFVTGARFQMFPGAHNDGFTAHLLRRR